MTYSHDENDTYYATIVETLYNEGNKFDSRLGLTYEILAATFVPPIGEMSRRQGFSPRLAWVDALQAVGGYFSAPQMEAALGHPMRIPYNEESSWGIYFSPSVFAAIWHQLSSTSGTRRAMIHFGHDRLGEHEKPCCTSMQFIIRDGKLHLAVNMRSWDIGVGYLYDTTVFNFFLKIFANLLLVDEGRIAVFVTSAHLYETDVRERLGEITMGEVVDNNPPSGRIFENRIIAEFSELREMSPWNWDFTPAMKTYLQQAHTFLEEYDIMEHKAVALQIQTFLAEIAAVFVQTQDNAPVIIGPKGLI